MHEINVPRESMTTGRDVLNERPTKEDVSMPKPTTNRRLGRGAVIHTTMGDIHIKLFPDEYLFLFSHQSHISDVPRRRRTSPCTVKMDITTI